MYTTSLKPETKTSQINIKLFKETSLECYLLQTFITEKKLLEKPNTLLSKIIDYVYFWKKVSLDVEIKYAEQVSR